MGRPPKLGLPEADTTPKKGRLTLTQLAAYDDVLTDALVDHVYFWTTIRKNRAKYSSTRGISEEDVCRILLHDVIVAKNVSAAEEHLLELSGFKKYYGSLPSSRAKEDFRRHMRKYIEIWLPDCPFEVSTTNRYTITTDEAATTAKRFIKTGETIKYLCGNLVAMTPEEEQEMDLNRQDFSVVLSSRKKTPSLFLGPARFANHDCNGNARLLTKGQEGMIIIADRDINIGEEITVNYGEHYFGEGNCECLCGTCESHGRGGWLQSDEAVEAAGHSENPKVDVENREASSAQSRGLASESTEQLPSTPSMDHTQRTVEDNEVSSHAEMLEDRPSVKSDMELQVEETNLALPTPPGSTRKSSSEVEESVIEIRSQSPELGSTEPLRTPDTRVVQVIGAHHATSKSREAGSKPLGAGKFPEVYEWLIECCRKRAEEEAVKAARRPSSDAGSDMFGFWTRKAASHKTTTAYSNSTSLTNDYYTAEQPQALTSYERGTLHQGSPSLGAAVTRSSQQAFDSPSPAGAALPPMRRQKRKKADPQQISNDESESSGVPLQRESGDYIRTPLLLALNQSRWVDCRTCGGTWVQRHGDQTRKECPRCERHSKLFGYIWPKTENARGDMQPRVMDHRTVHRFLSPAEEKEERKKGRGLGKPEPLVPRGDEGANSTSEEQQPHFNLRRRLLKQALETSTNVSSCDETEEENVIAPQPKRRRGRPPKVLPGSSPPTEGSKGPARSMGRSLAHKRAKGRQSNRISRLTLATESNSRTN